jgi:Ca2+-binding RTX toxin-like protein
MTTIYEGAHISELALAAYAKLDDGVLSLRELQNAGLSEQQARRFITRYTVVEPFVGIDTFEVTDPKTGEVTGSASYPNGVSATVFKDEATQTSILAIRGTDDLRDLVSDLIDVVVLGKPKYQYQSLKKQVVIWLNDGTLSASFIVTGHSVGGFMATAIAADFSSNVQHAYLYNSPGLNGIQGAANQTVLEALGITAPLDLSKISNIKADAGISPVSGLGTQVSPPILIRIENQLNLDQLIRPLTLNHSQQVLSDALALYSAFAQLDPSIGTDFIGAILLADSGTNSHTLESGLDVLRKIVLGEDAVKQAPTVIGNRESFFTNLYDLTKPDAQGNATGIFVSLQKVLKFSSEPIATAAAAASTDFGAFLSLALLTPFVLTLDESATAILKAVHASLYDQWEADRALSEEDRAAGKSTFSYQWYADRTQFLTSLLAANTADSNATTSFDRNSWIFNDLTTSRPIELFPQGASMASINPAKINLLVFGTDGVDTGTTGLKGSTGNDRLYGGAGDDLMTGGPGDDYLEGNADNDILEGEQGRDQLLGGAGDDTFNGGKDNDTLRGGQGRDLYDFKSGDGWDWIDDSDGLGSIHYDGLVLDGADFVAPNVWQKSDDLSGKTFTYGLYEQLEGGQSMQVLAIQGPNGGMWVRDWQDGRLGIFLKEAPAPTDLPDGPQSAEIKKTNWHELDHAVLDARGLGRQTWSALGDFGEVMAEGELQGNASSNYLLAGIGDDVLYGMQGRDSLIANAGNDKLYGGEDDDALSGGADNDYLDGGSGSDVLAGGLGSDILAGGAGDDFLFGGSSLEAQRGQWNVGPADSSVQFNEFSGYSYLTDDGADVLRGGDGKDRLWGGAGDDQLLGENDDDVLVGDDGDDQLLGGAGADKLFGDGSKSSFPMSYILAQYHGHDLLDGGEGDDTLSGDGGSDELIGGDGDDVLTGDADDIEVEFHGEDTLDGGNGNDRLYGYGKNDTLTGGAGDDYLEGDAKDVPYADHGDDWLDGGEGADRIQGDGGNDVLFGGAGDDFLFGDADDVPEANQGDDYLDGEDGNDYLRGYGGNDMLLGGAGDDQLGGEAGDDVLDGGRGQDILEGGQGNDILVGGAGSDVLRGGDGDDIYVFRSGDSPESSAGEVETLYETSGRDTVRFEAGITLDQLQVFAANDGQVLLIQFGSDQLAIDQGLSGAVEMFEFSDGLRISYAELLGRLAQTPMQAVDAEGHALQIGGMSDDTLLADQAYATISGGRGDDILQSSGGNTTYLYNKGDGTDRIIDTSAKTDAAGQAAFNTLRFGAGIAPQDIRLGLGSLLLMVGDDAKDAIHIEGFNPADAMGVESPPAIDRYQFADGTVLTHAELLARGFAFTGTDGNDVITGTSVNDRIDGGAGDDTLIGGMGSDSYFWGRGSGRDVIDNSGDSPGEHDTLQLLGPLTARELVLERRDKDLLIRLLGGEDQITVRHHFNGSPIVQIRFEDGSTWDAEAIAAHLTEEEPEVVDPEVVDPEVATPDRLPGGPGDDSFIVDHIEDIVIEAPNQGTDTVESSVDWTLGPNIENLSLTGSRSLRASGNGLNNVLRGNSAGNALRGEAGADTLYGDAGDDFLYGGPGIDSLRGEDGNDTLFADGGADVLVGGKGDDSYVFESLLNGESNAEAQVIEAEGEGYDSLYLPYGGVLPANVERLVISSDWDTSSATGNALDNTLVGNKQSNFIDGAAGADTMTGREGDDTYVVDDLGDQIIETVNAGRDSVRSRVDHSLAANVEDLILMGNAPTRGSGNDLNNTLNGSLYGDPYRPNAFNSLITNNRAANVLAGGKGNDTYILGQGDSVVENADEGIDTVIIADAFSGTASLRQNFQHVENLTLLDLTEGAADIEGSDADNILIGNRYANHIEAGAGNDRLRGEGGDDWLDGGSDADTMEGGEGDDTYVVDDVGDRVIESGAGVATVGSSTGHSFDIVLAHIDFALPEGIEALYLQGEQNINGQGNALNNNIDGNYADNQLTGGRGDDTLRGGNGSDTYVFALGDGADQIDNRDWDSDDWSAERDVDTLQLAPNISLADVTLGRLGNDLLVMVGTSDSVTVFNHFALDGKRAIDQIRFADGTVWLPEEISRRSARNGTAKADSITGGNGMDFVHGLDGNDTISGGAGNDSLHGDAGNDKLSGNAGDDFLDGGVGADTMIGSAGNDIYVVDQAGDVVTEVANEGLDGVWASATHTLSSNVEWLHLRGQAAIDGTGNALNNLILGNAAANTLNGAAGTDILQGGAGNDVLNDSAGNTLLDGGAGDDSLSGGSGHDFIVGGAGNDRINPGTGADVIAFNRGDGNDLILASAGRDNTLSLGGGIRYQDLYLEQTANDLVLHVGEGESLAFKDWYLNSSNRSVLALQLMMEGSTDYDPESDDPLYNSAIQQFDFNLLTSSFDAARAVASVGRWSLFEHLPASHVGGSDVACMGGDLAHYYGNEGTLLNISMMPALSVLSSVQFGLLRQARQTEDLLQDGSPRLL